MTGGQGCFNSDTVRKHSYLEKKIQKLQLNATLVIYISYSIPVASTTVTGVTQTKEGRLPLKKGSFFDRARPAI